jgi:hypothetical protein
VEKSREENLKNSLSDHLRGELTGIPANGFRIISNRLEVVCGSPNVFTRIRNEQD